MDLLPVGDPSLSDEVSWVPASPLPEQPVQVGGKAGMINAFVVDPDGKFPRPLLPTGIWDNFSLDTSSMDGRSKMSVFPP